MTTAHHQAGAAVPQRIDDLRDTTKCPACFTPLRSATCHSCGLDLRHSDAATLADVSAEAARLLQRRVELIAGIRVAVPASSVPAAPAPAVVHAPTTAPVSAPAAPPTAVTAVSAAAPAPTPGPTTPAPTSATPRRSGVQVALLITGISLLSVFAIFFMVYAFINYGLVWRSIIIGTVTVAAFVGASLLRRRSLGASSEAIAVFALVLVYLDAFALRANDLFGLEGVEGRAYWGTVFVVSSVGFIAWYRIAKVRAASLVGYTMLPIGVAVLGNVLSEDLPAAASVYIGALAVALAGVVQHSARLVTVAPVSPKPALPERVIVAVLTAPALLVAAVAAITLAPDQSMGLTLGLLGCAVVAALLTLAHAVGVQHAQNRVLAAILGAATGLLLASAAAGYGARTFAENDLSLFLIAAPVLVIALLLVLPVRRAAGAARRPLVLAAVGAAAIASVAVLPSVIVALLGVALQLADAVTPPRTDPTIAKTLSAGQFDAHLVLALTVVTIAMAALLLRALARVRGLVATVGVAVLLTAPPLLPSPWTVIAAWTLLGTAGLAIRVMRPHWAPGALSLAATGGIVLAWTAGWVADATWPATSAVAVVATIVARRVARSTWARATLSAVTAVVLIVTAAATAHQLTDDPAAAAPGAFAAAAVLLAAAAAQRLPLSRPEHRTVFWTGLAAAMLAAVAISIGWGAEMALAPVTIAGGVALTAALIAWALRARETSAETLTAAILLAPALGFTLSAVATVALAGDTPRQFAPAAAALVVAAGALFATARSDRGAPRWAFDLGVAAATAATLLALSGGLEPGWVVLLLVAATVTISATSADGLVGSRSRRRHLGWMGLVLATIALWSAIFNAGVEHPEPYVLPPAVALIAIAVLIRRRELRAGVQAAGASAWVLLLGLLLALVPLAAADHGSDRAAMIRAVAVLAVSAVLLLTASAAATGRATRGGHPRLAAAVGIAGLIGTLLVTVLQSGEVIANDEGSLEAWLAPGTAAVIIASLIIARAVRQGQVTAPTAQASAMLPAISAGLFRIALAIAAAFETLAVATSPGDDATVLRATIIVAVLALLHVASVAWPVVPLGSVTAWIALGLAVIAAVTATGQLSHIEQATAPLALALIASGGIRLHRAPRARSWPHLGPGVAVLLLPSLFATFGDAPAWRLVALGVVGIVVVIAGVTLRLQAPFVIGTIVVIVHALHTFAPHLRVVYEAADWYIWAGVGGVIVTAIAIRYEQRLRDLRRVAGSIASLR